MKKVRILVVKEDIIIAQKTCDTLESIGYEALQPAKNYKEALETIKTEFPDVALIDLQLSGKNTGIDIAKIIKEKYNFPFIFLTPKIDTTTINLAKVVIPAAYLIRPFTINELHSSIEVALFNFSKKAGSFHKDNLIIKDSVFIKDKGSYKKVKFTDILYIKSAHVYIEIYLEDEQKHLIRTSLTAILESLDSSFIRIHRSYIINTNHLSEIKPSFVKVNNIELAISKKYKEDLVKRINLI